MPQELIFLGDSGGGLIVEDEGRVHLVGVVSGQGRPGQKVVEE